MRKHLNVNSAICRTSNYLYAVNTGFRIGMFPQLNIGDMSRCAKMCRLFTQIFVFLFYSRSLPFCK